MCLNGYRVSIFVVFMTLMTGCSYHQDRANAEVIRQFKRALEYGYYEGQKDALTGSIRISLDDSGDTQRWVWIISPWDDGTPVEPETESFPAEKNTLRWGNNW